MDHVSTQIPYVVVVASICFVTYLFSGIVKNWVICLLTGTVMTLAVLVVIRIISGKDSGSESVT
ncbi:hypothetical protein [Butyrivibrio sp. WCE2006]|uniref:hypothetical protein n=1 Tax=Butyrivibrio sp. WCE2006 TaxID=1410611 RepID=UPI003FA4ADA1